MKTAHGYGPYAELLDRPATRRLIRALNAAAREAGVRYLVVGGSAAYLHTKRNPLDYPDLDVVVDAPKSGAKRLVSGLRRKLRVRVEKLAETEADVFYKVSFGRVEVDLFTEQEDRPNLGLPVMIAGVPVKRIEGLIAEKLWRFSYPDVLMLFDLLRKRHDRGMVRRFAQRSGNLGRLRTIEKIALSGASVGSMRRWAALMAGGERRGHFV